MNWARIRSHYATLFAQRGMTQEAVAKAGHLHAQTAISKLLDNEKRGPSVETFVRAVLGLGMTLSGFFAGLEQASVPEPTSRPVEPSILERLQQLERALELHFTTVSPELETPVSVSGHHGRSPHVESSLSGAGVVHHTTIGLGLRDFEAIVKTQFDLLRHQLERLTDRVERDLEKNRTTHRRSARPRARPRARNRKSA
jgi:transcriptional regulator with XRE-family HTH domain